MRGFTLTLVVSGLLIGLSCGELVRAGDWNRFRGPNGSGIADEQPIPTEWSAESGIQWKAELPGQGNSSPIVAGDTVFVTAAERQGRERTLYAFDRTTGEERWKQTVTYDRVAPTHDTNPYCGSTPVSDGQRVVVWHGSAGLFCYSVDGEPQWELDPGDVAHIWGYGASPIIHDNTVYLNHGPGEDSFLIAVDLESGEERWRTEEPGAANDKSPDGGWVGSWSTPVIIQVEGQEQLLCSMPERVAAYDLEDGSILWYVYGLNNQPRGSLAYTSPVVDHERQLAVVMGGFNGPAIGFRLGGSGDMTEQNRLWRSERRNPQRIGSGVIIDGLLYMANAGPGIVQCIDPATGEVRWSDRPSAGGEFWGSVIAVGKTLMATNRQGTTIVFRANPERFEPIAANPLNEPTNSTPAVAEGELFLRTQGHLWCVSGENR